MEYELQLNPFMRKEGWKYKVIQITDITLHTSHKQPSSIGKEIRRAFNAMMPGRIYRPISYAKPTESSSPENKKLLVDFIKKDLAFIKMLREEEKNGYKILLQIPKEIPVLAGQDTIEFLASVNGKRVLRGLAKNN